MTPITPPGTAPKKPAAKTGKTTKKVKSGQTVNIYLSPSATAKLTGTIAKKSSKTGANKKFLDGCRALFNEWQRFLRWTLFILATLAVIALLCFAIYKLLILVDNMGDRIHGWYSTPAAACSTNAVDQSLETTQAPSTALPASSGQVDGTADANLLVNAEDDNGRSTIDIRSKHLNAHISYPSVHTAATPPTILTPIPATVISLPDGKGTCPVLDEVPSQNARMELGQNPKGIYSDERIIPPFKTVYVPVHHDGIYDVDFDSDPSNVVDIDFKQSVWHGKETVAEGKIDHVYLEGVYLTSKVAYPVTLKFDSKIRQ